MSNRGETYSYQTVRDITAGDIIDVLTTALEAGFPWWMGVTVERKADDLRPWYDRLADRLEFCVTYECPETGDDKTSDPLSIEALGKVWAEHPELGKVTDAGMIDANDADVLLQILAMGEVVYG